MSLPVIAAQSTAVSSTAKATQASRNQSSFTLNFWGNIPRFTVRNLMPTEALITGTCALSLGVAVAFGVSPATELFGIVKIVVMLSELAFLAEVYIFPLAFGSVSK